MIPAPLKILKVLVVELQSASGAALDPATAANLAEEGSDDGDWEDEPNPFVDLGSSFSREQLMKFAAEEGPGSGRQRDDETQAFLVDFFKRAAVTPGFEEEFNGLTEEEKQRLRDSAA
jgi:importin-9